MRILACADLHGRAERIARVRALVAEHTPAVLLLPGDLTHVDLGRDALTLLDTLPVPVLAVSGNMDGPLTISKIRQHGRLHDANPVVIEGVSFGGPRVGSRCDVLVVHEPPYGTLDVVPSGRHIGSQHVLELAKRIRPRVLTCGHVHEAGGVARLDETTVINCTMGDGKSGGALIELTAQDVTTRMV
ncbi:MAG: metallophosphoesterase family protein [bacterium]